MAKIEKIPLKPYKQHQGSGKQVSFKGRALNSKEQAIAEKVNENITLLNNHDVDLDLLRKQFTDLIVKLQAFGTLPLEKYDKPAVDELSPGPQQAAKKDSAKVQKLKKKDPF